MKKCSLRLLSSLLTIVLLCNSLPAGAVEISDGGSQTPETGSLPVSEPHAAELAAADELELFALPEEPLSGTCGDDLTWTLTPEGVLTISGSGSMYDYRGSSTPTPWYPYLNEITELHLPEGMTHIGAYAFWSMYNLQELIIPSTVKTIGQSGCSYLRKITHLEIPASVTTIGESAFDGCSSLTELVIPDTVTSLGAYAFQNCGSLERVSIGNGVHTLPERVFYHSEAIRYVHLSAGVHVVDTNAFSSVKNMVAFTVDPENPYFSTDVNGILYNKDLTQLHLFPGRCMPEGVHEYTIPAHVSIIMAGAFRGNGLITHLTIPSTVTVINEEAFANASLRSVRILGCRVMGDSAFYANSQLEALYIGPDVRDIGSKAFSQCRKLKELRLENGLISIGSDAFYQCTALKEVTFPASLESIGRNAFYDCDALTTLNFSEGLESIGELAFSYCDGLRSITFPKSLGVIGEEAFYRCVNLRNLQFQEGLGKISKQAFCNCAALSAVDLPESLNTLGEKAFHLTNVKVAVFRGPAPYCTKSSNLFPNTATLYYMSRYDGTGASSSAKPWSSPSWNGYTAYPVMGDGDLDIQAGNYYRLLQQRYINFISSADPVYDVTMHIGSDSLAAEEDCDFISTAILADETQTARFTKDGMFEASLPCDLLSSFNTVEFYPTTTTEPFVQAAYGRQASSAANGTWNDLLHSGMTISAGSETELLEFYVDVNWNGLGAGKILLSQTSDGSDGWELMPAGGYCDAANYGPRLRAGLPLYLVLESADGQRFTQKLLAVVQQPRINMELETIPDVDIGAPEGSAGAHFEGLDLAIDLSDSIKLTFSIKEDGTLMGMLGFAPPAAADEQEALYNLVKDNLTSAAPDDDAYSLVEHLVKEHGGVVDMPKSGKMMVKVENQILGYVEGRYVQQDDGTYKPVLTEGAIAIKVEGEASYVYQTYLPPPASVPFYIKPSMNPSLQLTLPILKNDATGKLEAQPVRMNIEVPLRIAGGLGWESILSVGIYGEGKAALEGELTNQEGTCGYLEASFGAEAAVFCFSADVTIAQTDPWYFLGGPEMTLLAYESIQTSLQDASWEMQSRDYLNAPKLETLSLLGAEEDHVLQAGQVTADPVYPYADVQTALLSNGNTLAVWVGDDPQRTDANRTTLYYSVYDQYEQTWSSPAKVANDNTADFEPRLIRLDDTVYLIWKNAARPLTESDTVDTIPGVLDLKYGWFSTSRGGSFKDITTVSTANYDTCATITNVEGYTTAVWVSTTASGVFGSEDGVSCIYRKRGNQASELLASGLGYIDGLAASGDTVWFTADTDGNAATMDDRELFSISGGTVTQLTDDASCDSRPFFENGALAWYRDGTLYRNEEPLVIPADAGRVCYAAEGDVEAILYVQDDGVRKSTLYARFNNGSGWGAPMALTGITGNIGSLDAAFTQSGALSIVACERVLDENSGNDLADAAYLRHYTLNAVCDLAVTKVDYLAQTMVPEGKLTLMVDVENRGIHSAKMVRLSVSCEAGTVEPVIMFAELASGASETLFLTLDLPADLSTVGTISVTVQAENLEEFTPADNTGSTVLRLSDLTVEAAKAVSDGTETRVTALVGNRGQEALSDIRLRVMDGETVLAEEYMDGLAVDDGGFVTLNIPQGMAHLSLLTISAAADGLDPALENISSNNQTTVPVDGPKAQIYSVTKTAAASEDGAIVSVEIHNGTAEERTTVLCAAAYNLDGKMLDIHYASYVTAAGESTSVTLPLSGGTDVEHVRFFLLNTDLSPAELPETIKIR